MPDNLPHLNAVDMSMWGGELTSTEAQCMVDSGIKLIIVGTGRVVPGGLGQWSRQQAAMALDHGMLVDGYMYTYFEDEILPQVDRAIASVHGIPIRQWWANLEDVTPAALARDVATRIARGVEVCERFDAVSPTFAAGVGTGGWYWRPYMGDTDVFSRAGRPLWNAYYDGDPDTDGLPYGGWTDSSIEQFQGTTTVCGQSVDLNYAKAIPASRPLDDPDLAAVLNDYLVIRRDLEKVSGRAHPTSWVVHRMLREAGMLEDAEYRGNYRGYA